MLCGFFRPWFTLIYCPVAHWVWGSGGWLAKLGALDFAGGIVVHITAGVSAMALALVLAAQGVCREAPHGAGEYSHGGLGCSAALVWLVRVQCRQCSDVRRIGRQRFCGHKYPGCSGAITWMFLAWIHQRPSLLGVATGAVVGLAAITPAAGFVSPLAAIPIGMVGAVISFYVMM